MPNSSFKKPINDCWAEYHLIHTQKTMLKVDHNKPEETVLGASNVILNTTQFSMTCEDTVQHDVWRQANMGENNGQ